MDGPVRAARPCAACRARRRGGRARPKPGRPRRLVAGAAGDEPAHRVPDERDLLDGDRPGGHERLEQRRRASGRSARCGGRCCSAARPACAEVAGQPLAVGRAAAEPPRVLGLHQAVDEHDEPRGAPGTRPRGRRARRTRRPGPAPPSAAQVGALAFQRVAVEAVEHRERQAPRGVEESGRPSPASRGASARSAALAGERRATAQRRRRRRARSRRASRAPAPRTARARGTRAARSPRACRRCRRPPAAQLGGREPAAGRSASRRCRGPLHAPNTPAAGASPTRSAPHAARAGSRRTSRPRWRPRKASPATRPQNGALMPGGRDRGRAHHERDDRRLAPLRVGCGRGERAAERAEQREARRPPRSAAAARSPRAPSRRPAASAEHEVDRAARRRGDPAARGVGMRVRARRERRRDRREVDRMGAERRAGDGRRAGARRARGAAAPCSRSSRARPSRGCSATPS